MAHYLLEICHMNPFVCDRNVSTPMHIVCMHGHVEAFDYFLRKEVISSVQFSHASQFFKGFSEIIFVLSYFLPKIIENKQICSFLELMMYMVVVRLCYTFDELNLHWKQFSRQLDIYYCEFGGAWKHFIHLSWINKFLIVSVIFLIQMIRLFCVCMEDTGNNEFWVTSHDISDGSELLLLTTIALLANVHCLIKLISCRGVTLSARMLRVTHCFMLLQATAMVGCVGIFWNTADIVCFGRSMEKAARHLIWLNEVHNQSEWWKEKNHWSSSDVDEHLKQMIMLSKLSS